MNLLFEYSSFNDFPERCQVKVLKGECIEVTISDVVIVPGTYFSFIEWRHAIKEFFLDHGKGLDRASLEFPKLFNTMLFLDTKDKIISHHVLPYNPAETRRLVGEYFLVSASFDDRNLYHWMFTVLYKLWCLDATGLRRRMLIAYQPSPNQVRLLSVLFPELVECLEYYKIEEEAPQVSGSERESLKIDQLSIIPYERPSREFLLFLRERLRSHALNTTSVAPGGVYHDLIYVSRGDAVNTNRLLINRSSIEATFIEFGFEVVAMGRMSIDNQIALAAQAKIFAFEHGAGGSWIAAIDPKCLVLEIISPSNTYIGGSISTHYYDICQLFGDLSYHQLVGSIDPKSEDGHILYTISVELLKQKLSELKLEVQS